MQLVLTRLQLEDYESIKFLSTKLAGLFNIKTKWARHDLKLKEWAYDRERKQWEGEELLRTLPKDLEEFEFSVEHADAWLLVTSASIFTKSEKNSLGLAKKSIAMMSTHPFEEDKARTTQYRKRLTYSAVYYVAMAIGLRPCSKSSCLASFSNSLVELDLKKNKFCPSCIKKLQKKGISL